MLVAASIWMKIVCIDGCFELAIFAQSFDSCRTSHLAQLRLHSLLLVEHVLRWRKFACQLIACDYTPSVYPKWVNLLTTSTSTHVTSEKLFIAAICVECEYVAWHSLFQQRFHAQSSRHGGQEFASNWHKSTLQKRNKWEKLVQKNRFFPQMDSDLINIKNFISSVTNFRYFRLWNFCAEFQRYRPKFGSKIWCEKQKHSE